MVKIYPKVFPSTVSWVASETKENNAGKLKKVDSPKRITIIMIIGRDVEMVSNNPITPTVR